jgi:hypothetical protein
VDIGHDLAFRVSYPVARRIVASVDHGGELRLERGRVVTGEALTGVGRGRPAGADPRNLLVVVPMVGPALIPTPAKTCGSRHPTIIDSTPPEEGPLTYVWSGSTASDLRDCSV